MATLRPDWEEKPDAEKIHGEVKRHVQKYTCRTKFRVHQVGEGKHRFPSGSCTGMNLLGGGDVNVRSCGILVNKWVM
ncbi:hypothetical protein QYM36_009381 [Artemia franciscana]|uniref:GAR domain-containing protein n=1 Tax=Artemia franciscana TaxID=6661 RepID=A0AA88L1V4_ARTSF|nr:hypothetical protein QYM36_009381 [Artemia franciscana]